jgi:hypothetical protein
MTDFVNCPVDLHYLAENQPSLCIPRVFTDITSEFIRNTIEKVGLGKVARVDLLERRSPKGEVYQRAFIHFEKWNWNQNAQDARKRLITGNDIKIVYNNPWFWKISANRWTPQQSVESRRPQLPQMVAPALPPSVAPSLPLASPPMPIIHDQRMKPAVSSKHPSGHKKRNVLPKPSFPPRDQYVNTNGQPIAPPEDNLTSLNINAEEFKPLKISIPACKDEKPNEEVIEETPDQGLDIDYGNVPYPPPPPSLRRQKARWSKGDPKTPSP